VADLGAAAPPDRWSLLVPTTSYVCLGVPFAAWDESVTGTFARQAVTRSYGSCSSATGLRRARLLGLSR
jgi:hypothetical protein